MIYSNSVYWNSSKQWKPRTLYPLNGNGYVNARTVPGLTGNGWVVKVEAGKPVGDSTGRLAKESANDKLYWIETRNATSGQLLWVRKDVVSEKLPAQQSVAVKKPAATAKPTAKATTPPKAPAVKVRLSTKDGKGGNGELCIKNIIANDQDTHAHLVRAQYYRASLAKPTVSGVGVIDTKLEAALAGVTKSYNSRQAKIKASTLLRTSSGVSATVQDWMNRLKGLVSGPGVGVLPLAVVIPVAVVTMLGLSYLVWKAFFQDEPKSADDLKAAAHLSATYQNMSEAEKRFADSLLDNGVKAGFKEGQEKKSLFTMIKDNILLVGGGIVAFSYFKNKGSR